MKAKSNKVAAFIVPTGIGASIGGYAGDASLYARKFAKVLPLIVNPNVVNAACFSGITQNMFYTESSALELFFKGEIFLKPSAGNKIGVIFDKAISEKVFNINMNVINAVKQIYGINIFAVEITKDSVGVNFFKTQSGNSTGTIENPKTLLDAGLRLKKKGAQAIAVVCRFDDDNQDEQYKNAAGIDIIGGIEGVISHYLSKELMLPCAHAPAFEDFSISSELVSPKAAAEYITPTFLPCLFFGLENAPLIEAQKSSNDSLSYENVAALIMPANALGSPIVLESAKKNIPVFAVKENKTVLRVDAKALGIEKSVTEFETYDECLTELQAYCRNLVH